MKAEPYCDSEHEHVGADQGAIQVNAVRSALRSNYER